MKRHKSKKDFFEILPKEVVEKFFKEKNDKDVALGVSYIDKKLEDLCDLIGRKLTESEEGAILDIVDELTPRNKSGHYLVDLLPFEYAWEIYKAKLFSKIMSE